MAFGAFDSQITRRGYVTEAMDTIWSERSTVQSWYDVEAAPVSYTHLTLPTIYSV